VKRIAYAQKLQRVPVFTSASCVRMYVRRIWSICALDQHTRCAFGQLHKLNPNSKTNPNPNPNTNPIASALRLRD